MIYSKKTFCRLVGIETKSLSVYAKRNKVVIIDDLIDSEKEINKAFIEKKLSKLSRKNLPESPAPIVDINIEDIHEGQSYTESERQLKYLDTLKRSKEIEKLDIDIQKKRGEVVPSELIKPVFLQHNQSILTEFKNATDEIIRIFSKKKSLSVNEVAEIKSEIVNVINGTMNKAIANTVNSLGEVIN